MYQLAVENELLNDVLLGGKSDTERAQRIRLGKALGKRVDQVFGTYQLVTVKQADGTPKTQDGAAQYRLRRDEGQK